MGVSYTKLNGEVNSIPIFMLHTIPIDGNYLIRSLEKNSNLQSTIFVIDLPNHGKSEDINLQILDFEIMAQEIEKTRKELGIEQVHLFGHGIGGFVAQHYCINYSKSVKSLILSNTAPNSRYRAEMAWNIRDRFSKATKTALDAYYGKTDDQSVRARFTQSFAVYFSETNLEESKRLMDESHRIASETYVHLASNVIPTHDLREKIRKLNIPTLLITSKKDVMPPSAMVFIQNDIINSKLVGIDTGHFPMLEKSSEYWQLISSWLKELKA